MLDRLIDIIVCILEIIKVTGNPITENIQCIFLHSTGPHPGVRRPLVGPLRRCSGPVTSLEIGGIKSLLFYNMSLSFNRNNPGQSYKSGVRKFFLKGFHDQKSLGTTSLQPTYITKK